MSNETKPIPVIDNDSSYFWDQCSKQKLVLPYCLNCKRHHFYPRIVCPYCMSKNIEWRLSSGKGEIYIFTIARRPPMPAFKKDVPYVIAIIDLYEGPRMMSNIVNTAIDEIYCGMRVKVKFEYAKKGIYLPKIKPI